MEKSFYENVLTLQKSLCTLYITGTIESSNESVRKVLENGLDESLMLQDELYQTMKEDNFYTVENLTKTDIKETLTKLKGNE